MTVLCVLAFSHYFPHFSSISACLHSHSGLSMPHLACSVTCVTPICLGVTAMLPLAGFAHSHRSLAWSLTVLPGKAPGQGVQVKVKETVLIAVAHAEGLG